jgi:polysaccharide deacetylase family protein (PEP-CTERM system associated)
MPDTILFTVDVEDWFQVENFKDHIPFSAWDRMELRVQRNVHRILDLLDGNRGGNGRGGVWSRPPKATFFILGWIAEKVPGMVREIAARGHEVASHGYLHELCGRMDRESLAKDLTDSRKLLEDITGQPVIGYRAPNFSVDNGVLEVIAGCGYRYDASFNSFEMNPRYGKIDLTHAKQNGFSYRLSDRFKELPLSNLALGSHTVPFAGGGYFRLYPLTILKKGVRRILKRDKVYHFYMHPWEIDPGQPKVRQAGALARFRHYLNVSTNYSKLEKFIDSFQGCRFLTCRDYLGV